MNRAPVKAIHQSNVSGAFLHDYLLTEDQPHCIRLRIHAGFTACETLLRSFPSNTFCFSLRTIVLVRIVFVCAAYQQCSGFGRRCEKSDVLMVLERIEARNLIEITRVRHESSSV